MAHDPFLVEKVRAHQAHRAPRPGVAALAAYERLCAGHLDARHGRLPPRRAARSSASPFAVVVGCADHGLGPPRGLGLMPHDVLTISGLSTVVTPSLLDSVAFLVESEEAALVVVVGHAGCRFLCDALARATDDPIAQVVRAAVPDVAALARIDGDPVARASRVLAESAAEHLRQHPPIARRAIVCAAFEHRDGTVDLEDPPRVERLPMHLA